MGLVKKEGYLYKSPPECKIHKQNSWHNRYFVLAEIGVNDQLRRRAQKSKIKGDKKDLQNGNSRCDIFMMYWENQMNKKKGVKPKGVISLNSCSITTVNTMQFPHIVHNVLQLLTPKRVYYLCASSVQIMNEWAEVLNCCIKHSIVGGVVGGRKRPEGREEEAEGEEKDHLYAAIKDVLNELKQSDSDFGDNSSLSSGGSIGSSSSRSASSTLHRSEFVRPRGESDVSIKSCDSVGRTSRCSTESASGGGSVSGRCCGGSGGGDGGGVGCNNTNNNIKANTVTGEENLYQADATYITMSPVHTPTANYIHSAFSCSNQPQVSQNQDGMSPSDPRYQVPRPTKEISASFDQNHQLTSSPYSRHSSYMTPEVFENDPKFGCIVEQSAFKFSRGDSDAFIKSCDSVGRTSRRSTGSDSGGGSVSARCCDVGVKGGRSCNDSSTGEDNLYPTDATYITMSPQPQVSQNQDGMSPSDPGYQVPRPTKVRPASFDQNHQLASSPFKRDSACIVYENDVKSVYTAEQDAVTIKKLPELGEYEAMFHDLRIRVPDVDFSYKDCGGNNAIELNIAGSTYRIERKAIHPPPLPQSPPSVVSTTKPKRAKPPRRSSVPNLRFNFGGGVGGAEIADVVRGRTQVPPVASEHHHYDQYYSRPRSISDSPRGGTSPRENNDQEPHPNMQTISEMKVVSACNNRGGGKILNSVLNASSQSTKL